MTEDNATKDPVIDDLAADELVTDGVVTDGSATDELDFESSMPREAWAVVWREEDGFQLYVPDVDDDDEVPRPALALMGAILRLKTDPLFMHELAEFMARDERSGDRETVQ